MILAPFKKKHVDSQSHIRFILTRTREESLYESLLDSYVLVHREQELHENWWELTSESLYESFLNSQVLVKQEQELYESW